MKRHILILVAVAFAFSSVLTSCDKDVSVTGVSLSKSSLSLEVGNSETLTATVSPSDADNKSVTWNSSNDAVATVSNGMVTAIAAGSATITVTTTDGSYTATCAVTITEGTSTNTDPTFTVTFGSVSWTPSYVYIEDDNAGYIDIYAAKTNFSSFPYIYAYTLNETGAYENANFYIEYYETMMLYAVDEGDTTYYSDWWLYSGSVNIAKYSGGKFSGTITVTMFDAYAYYVEQNTTSYETRSLTVVFENIDVTNATKAAKAFRNSIERSKAMKGKKLYVKK